MMIVLKQYNITFKIADDIGDGQVSTVKLRAHQENIEKVLQCLIQSGAYHIEIDHYDSLKEYRDQQMAQTIKDPNHPAQFTKKNYNG